MSKAGRGRVGQGKSKAVNVWGGTGRGGVKWDGTGRDGTGAVRGSECLGWGGVG